jgi:hypothetical protein
MQFQYSKDGVVTLVGNERSLIVHDVPASQQSPARSDKEAERERIQRLAELHFYAPGAPSMDERLFRFAKALLASQSTPAGEAQERLLLAVERLQNIRDTAYFHSGEIGALYYRKAENALAEIENRDAVDRPAERAPSGESYFDEQQVMDCWRLAAGDWRKFANDIERRALHAARRATAGTTAAPTQYPHPDCDWACHYHCTEAGAYSPRCATAAPVAWLLREAGETTITQCHDAAEHALRIGGEVVPLFRATAGNAAQVFRSDDGREITKVGDEYFGDKGGNGLFRRVAGNAAPVEIGALNPDVLVLLRMRSPQANGKNVHVVLRKPLHCETIEEQNIHDKFLYEEHTCPTNWMGVEVLIDGEDTDPHGLFEHVQTVEMPDEEIDLDNITVEEIAELFSEFKATAGK